MVNMLTCSIRKISTGHRVSYFRGEHLDQLHLVAVTLMASPLYAGCYIVCTDAQKTVHFNLQPQQPQLRAHAQRLPQGQPFIDAEFEE